MLSSGFREMLRIFLTIREKPVMDTTTFRVLLHGKEGENRHVAQGESATLTR